jgi:hypothetical protein
MLAGGYMQRLYGARWGAAFGSVLYTGGLALSYWSIQHSYFLLILSMGLVSSFGQGVAYNCVLIQSQKVGHLAAVNEKCLSNICVNSKCSVDHVLLNFSLV